MQSEPLVTVIVVCYNQAPFVVECLESVRSQTYKNIELIIIDDCSEDNSVAVIESWIATQTHQPLFIVQTSNEGICKTFNEALRHASGEFISIIAADDVYMPYKTDMQVKVFQSLPPNAGVLYSDALQIDAAGNLLEQYFIKTHRSFEVMPQGNIFDTLLLGNFIPAMSTMVRRQCYETVGVYDEQLTYEDFDMWLRISRDYEFYFSPLVMAKYRILSTSMSRTMHVAGTWELLKSDFCIYEKCLLSGITGHQRKYVRDRLTSIGRQMYARRYADHTDYMMKMVRYDLSLFTVALWFCSMAAVPYERLSRLARIYRSLRDRLFESAYSSARNIVRE